ncbi:uncharacterized protein [Lolium perenne]|uniref:uncharacterized protein isoform X1 n=1 Tax=Lolium perenne TaxID=4522 RepID=UPI003A98E47D
MTQLCVGEEDQARSGLSAFEFPVILGVEKMPPQTVSALQQAVVGRRPALPILGTGFATIDGNVGMQDPVVKGTPPWRTSTPSSWVQETGGCSGPAAGWKVQGGGVLEYIVVEDSIVLEHGIDVKAGRQRPETRRCWDGRQSWR